MSKRKIIAFFSITLIMLQAESLLAQTSGSEMLDYSLIVLVGLVIVGSILLVAENLLKVEAKRMGINKEVEGRISLFPGLKTLFQKPLPKELRDKKVHRITQGYDMEIEGEIEEDPLDDNEMEEIHTSRYAVQPKNYTGIAPIPKVIPNIGDELKAGDPIFYDKSDESIYFCSPVSGEYVELNRGAKRSINELVILADKEIEYRELDPPSLEDCSREELVEFLKSSGGWVHIKQRPFNKIPDPEVIPKGIFISTFDTAPLAPSGRKLVEGREEAFRKGLELAKRLSENVYLGIDGRDGKAGPAVFAEAEGVDKHYFSGPHPSGNVGVHIHYIDPIRRGDQVWTLEVQDVITLGNLFLEKRYNAEKVIGIAGQGVKDRDYIKTHIGANVGEILREKLKDSDTKWRIISGDVLTGQKKSEEDYINAFEDMITVIKEGDYYEPFGWIVPQSLRPTVSHTFPNFMLPDIKYEVDTNKHGEKRAFVMTGQYEELLPMDIYLQHLMKAILIKDFERMEGLGILELVEEDVALAEFACTSKMPLQKILRDGLDFVEEQS